MEVMACVASEHRVELHCQDHMNIVITLLVYYNFIYFRVLGQLGLEWNAT